MSYKMVGRGSRAIKKMKMECVSSRFRSGMKVSEICQELGIPESTARRYLRETDPRQYSERLEKKSIRKAEEFAMAECGVEYIAKNIECRSIAEAVEYLYPIEDEDTKKRVRRKIGQLLRPEDRPQKRLIFRITHQFADLGMTHDQIAVVCGVTKSYVNYVIHRAPLGKDVKIIIAKRLKSKSKQKNSLSPKYRTFNRGRARGIAAEEKVSAFLHMMSTKLGMEFAVIKGGGSDRHDFTLRVENKDSDDFRFLTGQVRVARKMNGRKNSTASVKNYRGPYTQKDCRFFFAVDVDRDVLYCVDPRRFCNEKKEVTLRDSEIVSLSDYGKFLTIFERESRDVLSITN